MCRSNLLQFVLAVLVFSLASAARADTMALDITSVGTNSFCPSVGFGCNAGWTFHVNSVAVVTALGVWDAGSNGLSDSHPVGIWTSSGTLLTSATVSNSGTAVASASGAGQWIFSPISIQELLVGDYTIGEFYMPNSGDAVASRSAITSSPYITFGSAAQGFGASLLQPTSLFPFEDAGYFGPNFQILQIPAVPEPSSFLLFGTGLATLASVVRRKYLR